MEPRQYREILSQLDFTRRPGMLLRQALVDSTLIALSVYLLLRGGVAGYLAAQLILPVVFFRAFSLMHEAVHHAVSKSRLLNELTGILAGIVCFLPYESWKRLHLEHHRWAGNLDRDPSSKLRKDYDPRKRTKYAVLTFIWRSWVPLLGLMQELVFWMYPLQQLKDPRYSLGAKSRIAVSLVVPAGAYASLVYLWPHLFTLAHFGPAFVLYLMMVELINFPHHMDVPAFTGDGRLSIPNQYAVTRSSYYPLWFSRTFLLNFNLHTEHHLFPNLPWYQLDRARLLVKKALGGSYNESLGNAWIVKNRRLDLNDLLPVGPRDSRIEAMLAKEKPDSLRKAA